MESQAFSRGHFDLNSVKSKATIRFFKRPWNPHLQHVRDEDKPLHWLTSGNSLSKVMTTTRFLIYVDSSIGNAM